MFVPSKALEYRVEVRREPLVGPGAGPMGHEDEVEWVLLPCQSKPRRARQGVLENKHLTDVGSPPPVLRVCMIIQPEGNSCSDIDRVRVLNDLAARLGGPRGGETHRGLPGTGVFHVSEPPDD